MPRVSVIIPTYNRKDYVQAAIDSVLAQTFTDYEIIVVDDGSTDGTGELLRTRYGDRIKYVWQENAGGPAARNHGWRQSRGTFALFLDSDDLLLPLALEQLLSKAEVCPDAGVVGGRYEYVNDECKVIGESSPIASGERLDVEFWLRSCPFIPSATLVRSDWFEKTAGFDVGQEAAQDWDLWVQMALTGCPMVYLDQVVCQYRLHTGGLTTNIERQLRGHLRVLDKVFSSPAIPQSLEQIRPDCYANIHVFAAARFYAVGHIPEAIRNLERAAELLPDDANSGAMLEKLLRFRSSPTVSLDHEAYKRVVLDNLPTGFRKKSVLRGLARIEAAQLFEACKQQDWPKVRRLWPKVISQDIRWLGNIGLWSIMVESVVGSHFAGRLRCLCQRAGLARVAQATSLGRARRRTDAAS